MATVTMQWQMAAAYQSDTEPHWATISTACILFILALLLPLMLFVCDCELMKADISHAVAWFWPVRAQLCPVYW
jgi:hypothetical protein